MNASNNGQAWRVGLVAVMAIGIAVAAMSLNFNGRSPNPDLTALGALLGTLLFASAILERALDVWLSITMGAKADSQDVAIRSLKAKMESLPPEAKAVEQEKLAGLIADRATHQDATRRLAMPVAIIAGMVISAVGLRSLQPLFQQAGAALMQSPQGHVFDAIDIIVTGTLLAGGSDGIHWIVALYRDWMDKNRSTKS